MLFKIHLAYLDNSKELEALDKSSKIYQNLEYEMK
jgi:hypothetical protein